MTPAEQFEALVRSRARAAAEVFAAIKPPPWDSRVVADADDRACRSVGQMLDESGFGFSREYRDKIIEMASQAFRERVDELGVTRNQFSGRA